ncbi:protocatechuate 3,4-dioxygenase [Sorangium cellulosum]|uniref:Protocatechuate 3,4-dioxygenase n=1 Tax=Sorangium cellulosum TaxID=56 RepID=A0A150PP44_SORCE|nr:protocatechuate 3,4-dioxygenase [Sorangium cellulosum]
MRNKREPATRDLAGEVVDRWQFLVKLGALAITAPVIVSWSDEGSSDAGTGGGGGAGGGGGEDGDVAWSADSIDPSIFERGARCNLTTTDVEAPFFIDIDDSQIPNDITLFRSDLRDGHPGCEFRLYLRLVDGQNNGEPIPDAEVYIWHCDADGNYSGFNDQHVSTPYTSTPYTSAPYTSAPYTGAIERAPESVERFCRGVQLTDRNGIVGFTSIWPGWYAGRPVHVHLVARINGPTTRLITTELYFDAEFSRRVYQSEAAYRARSTELPASSLEPPQGSPAMPKMAYTPGLVTGILDVIVGDRA